MTQAVNLANFANNLDTSGGVAPSALNAAVPVSKGGTGDVTAAGARTNLGVPSTTGSGASGTWSISISGNAATATSATTAGNGGVTSVNGLTGAVTVTNAFQGIGAQLFTTVGANTFTVPAGVTAVKVTLIGGGGAGGGCPSSPYEGAGGGGGGVSVGYVTGLTPGSTVTVTVGAGGTGTTGVGNTGGTSSFGAYCSATGGAGGSYFNVSPGSGGINGGSSGTGSGGLFNLSGSRGGGAGVYSTSNPCCGTTYYNYSGGGGIPIGYSPWTYFVFAGAAGYTNSANKNGDAASGGYGSGGGGATRLSAGSQTGGAGSAGVVLVEY